MIASLWLHITSNKQHNRYNVMHYLQWWVMNKILLKSY